MFAPRLVRQIGRHADEVRGVAWAPEGRNLISCSADGTARLWGVTTDLLGKDSRLLNHPGEMLLDVAWAPDGHYLALASSAQVWVWDTVTDEPPIQLGGHRGRTCCLAYSPTGQRLVWGAQDGSVSLWCPQDRRLVRRLEHEHAVRGVAFSADGCILATATQGGLVSFFDAESGDPLDAAFQEAFWVTCVAFSPDGNNLVYGLESGEIVCIDMFTGQRKRSLIEHAGLIWRLAFSADGRFLGSVSEDGTARLWEIATGRQISAIQHRAAVLALAFAPSVKGSEYRFVVGGFDGSVSLYSYFFQVL